MDKEYVKKHFFGDLVRTLIVAFLIIVAGNSIVDRIADKKDQERIKILHEQHMQEWEEYKGIEALKSPEQRFEETVQTLDENGVLYGISYDESKIYIKYGPVRRDVDHSVLMESAKEVRNIYQMCADDEGLGKQVCIVAIGPDLQPIWTVD